MRKNTEQYTALLDNAAEIASAYLDMENGTFLLAWSSELIRDLAAEGYVRSAALTIHKLCETVNSEAQWTAFDEMKKEEKQAWFYLFAEALMDHNIFFQDKSSRFFALAVIE